MLESLSIPDAMCRELVEFRQPLKTEYRILLGALHITTMSSRPLNNTTSILLMRGFVQEGVWQQMLYIQPVSLRRYVGGRTTTESFGSIPVTVLCEWSRCRVLQHPSHSLMSTKLGGSYPV